jgi:hypothetical protein
MWHSFIGQHDCPGSIECSGIHLGSRHRCTAGRGHVCDTWHVVKDEPLGSRVFFFDQQSNISTWQDPRANFNATLAAPGAARSCSTYMVVLCWLTPFRLSAPASRSIWKDRSTTRPAAAQNGPCCSGIAPPALPLAGPSAKPHAFWVKAMVPYIVMLTTMMPMMGLVFARIWYLQVCLCPFACGVNSMPALIVVHSTYSILCAYCSRRTAV